MCREAVAHVKDRKFPRHIREHVNATFPLWVHGNPSERRAFALYNLDPRKVHVVFCEGLLNDMAVFIIADQPKPARACSQARNLGQHVGRHSPGVNLHPRRIDFFPITKKSRNQREKIHGAASNPNHFCFRCHKRSSTAYIDPSILPFLWESASQTSSGPGPADR